MQGPGLKNPVRATSCGFESHLRHNAKALQKDKTSSKARGQDSSLGSFYMNYYTNAL